MKTSSITLLLLISFPRRGLIRWQSSVWYDCTHYNSLQLPTWWLTDPRAEIWHAALFFGENISAGARSNLFSGCEWWKEQGTAKLPKMHFGEGSNRDIGEMPFAAEDVSRYRGVAELLGSVSRFVSWEMRHALETVLYLLWTKHFQFQEHLNVVKSIRTGSMFSCNG